MREAWAEAQRDGGMRTAGRTHEKYARGQLGGGRLVRVMLVIVIAAAVGYIGVKLNSELQNSINGDLTSIDAGNQTRYENASESIAEGFADAMGLTDIVFIVLMFGVILGVLMVFRART